jgi:hypothetical protein
MSYIIFIAILSVGSVLLPLTLAGLQWKKLSGELFALKWLLIASLLSDVLMFFAGVYFKNSYPVGNVFLIFQFSFFLYIFSLYRKRKDVVLIIWITYLTYYVLDVIFIENFFRVVPYASAIASFILILFSFQYLYKLLSELPTLHIQRLPMLWVTFSILLYSGGTLFIFLANNYLLTTHTDWQHGMWVLHNIFNILKNILFAIALWRNYKMVKSSTLS